MDRFTSIPQTSFAQSDTFASTFNASLFTLGHSWIVDLRVFYHMIGMSSFFFSYFICSRKDKVRITDGFYSSIEGKGSIHVAPTLPLSFVLHVLNFTLNLLFVSHLTKSLNCSVTFFPSHCIFQDLDLKMTISGGHKDNGLYILDISSHSALPVQRFLVSSIKDNNISSQ